MFEREYRDLAYVPRWGIVRQIHRQSVAEHSYFVALYADQICEVLGVERQSRATVVQAALYHDIDECFTSDIPGPVKRSTMTISAHQWIDQEVRRRFRECTGLWQQSKVPWIKQIIKVADLMDEVCHLLSERQMGNQAVIAAYDNAEARLTMAIDALPFSTKHDLRNMLQGIKMRHIGNQSLVPTNDDDVVKNEVAAKG